MKKSERTKQFIIEQAADLFNKKGIAGTSVDEVLQAAKVAKGCLYGHFQSKDELACASAEYLLDKLMVRRKNAMDPKTTAFEKLVAYIEINSNPVDDTYISGGCPILNFAVDADDTNEAIKGKVQSVINATLKMLSGIIKDCVKAGELSTDIHAEEMSVKIFSTIEGAAMISRVTGSPIPMKNAIRSLKKELATYELRK